MQHGSSSSCHSSDFLPLPLFFSFFLLSFFTSPPPWRTNTWHKSRYAQNPDQRNIRHNSKALCALNSSADVCFLFFVKPPGFWIFITCVSEQPIGHLANLPLAFINYERDYEIYITAAEIWCGLPYVRTQSAVCHAILWIKPKKKKKKHNYAHYTIN